MVADQRWNGRKRDIECERDRIYRLYIRLGGLACNKYH